MAATFPLRHWGGRGPLACLLSPFSLLFFLLITVRRYAYTRGWLRAQPLAKPVVVVGNIHVGGVGKTPLTMALAEQLQARGVQVGIISRGYGGNHQQATEVRVDSTAAEVGDEALLMRRSLSCPVFVARLRADAGAALLKQYPNTDLLLCDDGLQHYPLARAVEICVVDGYRGWGNGWLLPAGPLREGRRRLRDCDAVVVHGDRVPLPGLPEAVPRFQMQLRSAAPYWLHAPGQLADLQVLQGRRVLAVAGIGDPQRFFASLPGMGIQAMTRAFADHHVYTAADLAGDFDFIVTTEKDAVKCRGLDGGRMLVLPVRAELTPSLVDWLLRPGVIRPDLIR